MAAVATSKTGLDFTAFYNVIDGKLSSTVNTSSSPNPSTLDDNLPFPLSTSKDVDRAVDAATQAASLWAEKTWADRQASVRAFAEALDAVSEDFVQLLVKEQGKPVRTLPLQQTYPNHGQTFDCGERCRSPRCIETQS
jgi:delta 1-pyrroline-5-carboxylate dehydrogenase